MPIVVNSNTTATITSFNLSRANDAMRKSLARLSSGKRIVSPADDAGGMAVGYKIDSALKRTEAVRQNLQNGISFLQVQDGAMSGVADVLNRMAELKTMASDVVKNSSDVHNYSKEFVELQEQLHQIKQQKFNGISLFAENAQDRSNFSRSDIINEPKNYEFNFNKNNSTQTAEYDKYSYRLLTSASAVAEDGSISLNVINLQFVLSLASMANYNLGGFSSDSHNQAVSGPGSTAAGRTTSLNGHNYLADITQVSIQDLTIAISKLADVRAENGAEQNRLHVATELLMQNQTNLEAAHGRIVDADIALESTRMARQNVLVQSSAAMLAQANQLTNIALQIIG
jgi:flagellin